MELQSFLLLSLLVVGHIREPQRVFKCPVAFVVPLNTYGRFSLRAHSHPPKSTQLHLSRKVPFEELFFLH